MSQMRAIDLSNRKYLVTGASSGLGRDIAVFLSECGAQLVITGRNEKKLDETFKEMGSDGHLQIICDIAREEDLSGVFSEAVKDGKRLDGLVHCAGVIPLSPLNTISRKSIDDCMAINFYSLLELVRCFAKKKYREEKTSIVEISSVCSQYPGKCQTLYAASKAAANAAVQALALEVNKMGIRINSVLPGTINTPGIPGVIEKIGGESFSNIMRPQIHGLVEMREVSNIVGFMLSDLSSAVTGRIVYADGGYINY